MTLLRPYFRAVACGVSTQSRRPVTMQLALLVVLGAPACGAISTEGEKADGEELEVSVADEALMGASKVDASCDSSKKAMINESARLGRIAASSNAFAECLDLSMRQRVRWENFDYGPYRECNGKAKDPYAGSSLEAQIAALYNTGRSPNDVFSKCDEATGNNASTSIGSYGHAGNENLTWHAWLTNQKEKLSGGTGWFAWPWPMRQAAGILWHEASHTHGWTHGANDQPNAIVACGYSGDATWNFQRHTAPYILGNCISDVLKQSELECGITPTFNGSCKSSELLMVDGYNSATCHCVPDVLDQPESGDAMGSAFASGDFDGDGFKDLAVGAPGENSGEGRVFLYRGTSTGLKPYRVLDQSSLGVNEGGDRFGTSLAAGDFNKDGLADLAVGAPGEVLKSAAGNVRSGVVFLFRGSAGGLVPVRYVSQTGLATNSAGDDFGRSVLVADLTGDGYAELAVGAPQKIVQGTARSGAVFVFKGSSSASTLVSAQALIEQRLLGYANEAGDQFGATLAAGQLDAVAGKELIVGAPGEDGGQGIVDFFSVSGSTYAAWITKSFTGSALDSALSGNGLGKSLAVGDLNGDGRLDVAAGAPTDGGYGSVFVYRGTANGLSAWTRLVQGGSYSSEQGDRFGSSLAAGQFGGSAAADLFVGAPGEEAFSGVKAGAVFVAWGGSSLATNTYWNKRQLGTEAAGDVFGTALAMDDYDANGQMEVTVGAPVEEAGGGFYDFTLHNGQPRVRDRFDQKTHSVNALPMQL